MREILLETGEWEITFKQIGFYGKFKSLEEGRAEVIKKFGGAK